MKFWQVIAALSAAGGGACVAKALARALFPATKPQNRFRRVLADPRNDLPFPHHRRRTLSAGADGRAAVPTSSSPACHPYALEINSLIEQARAATAATLSAVAPPLLLPPPPPLPLEQTPLVTVSTRRQLADLAQRLLDVDEFAVDVEHHAYRSYLGLTCLVQISTRDADYLVDALALHDHMHLLSPPFADPSIVKVLHGAGNDVRWLQRDFALYVVNMFDTQVGWAALAEAAPHRLPPVRFPAPRCTDAAVAAEEDAMAAAAPPEQQQQQGAGSGRHISLAHLLQRLCGVSQDKRHQLSDWRRRPLPDELVRYARTDAHYLLYIAQWLRQQLVRVPVASNDGAALQGAAGAPVAGPTPRGGGAANGSVSASGNGSKIEGLSSALVAALVQSHQVSLALYNKPVRQSAVAAAVAGLFRKYYSRRPAVAVDASSSSSDGGGGGGSGSSEALLPAVWVATELCGWRDDVARREDESPQHVLPDAALLALAMRHPATDHEVVYAAERAVDELNRQASQLAPFAARHEVSTALRRHAARVCGLIRTAATAAVGYHSTAAPAAVADGALEAASSAAAAAMLPPAGNAVAAAPPTRALSAAAAAAAAAAAVVVEASTAAAKREAIIKKFSAKRQVYDSCRILSRSGQLLCYCDRRKFDWYLRKGLAEQVPDEPAATIRLLFDHQMADQSAGVDTFYAQSKANCCVGCGEAGHYLRYRIVPTCYRKQLPVALKSHRSHDVVLLCIDCHRVAHTAAERTKKEVAAHYGVPLQPTLAAATDESGPAAAPSASCSQAASEQAAAHSGRGNGSASPAAAAAAAAVSPGTCRRSALALQQHGCQMPPWRKRQLEEVMLRYLGRPPPPPPPPPPPQPPAEEKAGTGQRGDDNVCSKGPAASSAAATATAPWFALTDATGQYVSLLQPGDMAVALVAGLSRRNRRRKLEGFEREAAKAAERLMQQAQQLRSAVAAAAPAALAAAEGAVRTVGEQQQHDKLEAEALEAEVAAARKLEEASVIRKLLQTLSAARGGGGGGGGGGTGAEVEAAGSNGSDDDNEEEEEEQADGEQEDDERKVGAAAASSAAAAASRPQAPPRLVASRDRLLELDTHAWHGARVVEAAMSRGGEAELHCLIQRFRCAFVDAVRPKHLPAAWAVDHAADRRFGSYSIYHSRQQQQPSEL